MSSQWIEALVVLGKGDDNASPLPLVRGNADFNNRASIIKCIPDAARKQLPPQLSVCCLPTGIQRKPFHHRSLNKYYDQYNVILTDQMGNKTYGYCCTFFDICSEVRPEGSAEIEFAYMKCLCLISKEPLYESFETLVETMYTSCFRQRSVLNCDYELLGDIVKRINLLPKVKSNPLHVIMPIDRKTIHFDLEILSEGLPSPIKVSQLLEIEPKVLMILFEAILLERKVILRSKSKSKLSRTSEALCELLYPLKWQHIYIPIVPEGLTEYLEAPTPYLMGVLSDISTENLNYEQSIEIDIDKSTFIFGKDFSLPFSKDIMLMRKCLIEGARRISHQREIRTWKHKESDLRSLFLVAVTKILDQSRGYFNATLEEGDGLRSKAQAAVRKGGDLKASDDLQDEDDPNLNFLQGFIETQMFQNFFHDSPNMLNQKEFEAMAKRVQDSFSVTSEATVVANDVEIVTFQTLQPSLNRRFDYAIAKDKSISSSLKQREDYSTEVSKSDSKLQAAAIRSERVVDWYEAGLIGNYEANPGSNVLYREKAEELFDCIYMYFQIKYGNLLFDTSSSLVTQCIDSVGSAEYLTAMVDVFKFTLMESKEKVVRFRNLDTMQKLMSILADIAMKAIHSFDYLLAFGVLSMSIFIEYRSTSETERGITGFDYILDELPKSCSFWEELVTLIIDDSQDLEAEEQASGYAFVSDLLLMCSLLFGDDAWYESSVQSLAERLTQDDVSSEDLKMMLMLSKKKFPQRADYSDHVVWEALGPNSEKTILTKFESGELGKLKGLSSKEREAAKNTPRSPVNAIDSYSDLVITHTCDGKVRLYSNANRNGSRLGEQYFLTKQKEGNNLVRFNLDGSKFYVLSNKIGIWDTHSCKSIRSIEIDEAPSCVCIQKNSGSKDFLIAGDEKGFCKLWDHLSSSSLASLSFHGHSGAVSKISFLDQGESMFVSSSRDGKTLLWDMRENSKPLYSMESHSSWITDHQIFYSKSKPFAVCGSSDWTSTVWDLETGHLNCTYACHSSPVQTIAICSNEAMEKPLIATGDRDGLIRFWQTPLDGSDNFGETLSTISTCSEPVLHIEERSDRFIACYANNTMVRWDFDPPVDPCGSTLLNLQCKAYYRSFQSFTACKIDYLKGFVHSGCANGDLISWNFKSTFVA